MRSLSLLILPICVCFVVNAQTTQPILTLNTRMHNAMIRGISTDALGKNILTCSDDKTAKLWDASTGELLHTFRFPIDKGFEGMLYACALSPDGKIAAIGGYTGYSWFSEYSIYIFNTVTGEMVRRLSGLPNVILDLEFSPNGKYLAASLYGPNGIRIFSTVTWSLEKTLTGYGNRYNRTAFDPQGRLVTVSFDGKIRLYDSYFNLIREKPTTGGKEPVSLCFSPDSHKLSIGYNDSPQLKVLDANDLSLLYEPDITDASTVDDRLNKVSFSKDGQYLYAGGFYSKKVNGDWWMQIRRWDNAGRGEYKDFSACRSGINAIKPMPDNSMIYCGSYPDFGRIKYDERVLYIQAEIHDYRAHDKSHLKVNYDGSLVGFTPLSKQACTFSLINSQLSEKQCTEHSYKDQAGNLYVTDCISSYSPKLNGKMLSFLKQYEKCESVDISEIQKNIVFGASWNLYCLDEAGQKKWETPSKATVWAVKVSGNEKVVVAAMGDGTIRWYRMSDGKNILSLFAHPDNQRWITWTPSGYYNCSAGAENLVGWHVNHGADKEASYYPASKLRSIYYRPDVIDKILETLDEDEALRLANLENNRKSQVVEITQMLPPTISIVSPGSGTLVNSNNISIQYRVQSPGGEPILGVRALVDGRPSEDARGFKPVGNEGTIAVTIPSRDCKVSLIAENQHGFSDPAVIAIFWKGVNATDILKPKMYLLAIGVSDYDKPDLKLQLAAKDARDFTIAFQKQKGGLFGDINVKLLTDKDATKDNILDGLDWLKTQTTSKDVAILFMAGHGMNDNIGTFYFLPVGADLEKISRTCLMFAEIKNTVAATPGKIIVFADACHSGNIMGGRRAVDVNGLVNELTSAENGAIVFTSSTGKQYSLEDPEWGNGAFTKALVEGINGEADLFGKGIITVKTLDAYISERVKTITKGQQSPTTIIPNTVPDFPIAIVR